MPIYEKTNDRIKWKLFQYVSPMGRRAIDDWRHDLSTPRQADLDSFLRNIVKKTALVFPDIRPLAGRDLKGLHELRWKGEGSVPHRIGGYFLADSEFVMLIGWTHKGKVYDPPAAFSSMSERKRKIQTMEASLCEYDIFTG